MAKTKKPDVPVETEAPVEAPQDVPAASPGDHVEREKSPSDGVE